MPLVVYSDWSEGIYSLHWFLSTNRCVPHDRFKLNVCFLNRVTTTAFKPSIFA